MESPPDERTNFCARYTCIHARRKLTLAARIRRSYLFLRASRQEMRTCFCGLLMELVTYTWRGALRTHFCGDKCCA